MTELGAELEHLRFKCQKNSLPYLLCAPCTKDRKSQAFFSTVRIQAENALKPPSRAEVQQIILRSFLTRQPCLFKESSFRAMPDPALLQSEGLRGREALIQDFIHATHALTWLACRF